MTLQKGNDVSAVAVFTHSLDTIQILDVKCTSYSFDIEAQQICFQWEKISRLHWESFTALNPTLHVYSI